MKGLAALRAPRWQALGPGETPLAALRAHRWQALGLIAAALVVCAGKQLYRDASPDELALFLAPTAQLVSLVTGVEFAREAGAGWLSREADFLIAPACAGVSFALAAFLALAIGWRRHMVSPGRTAAYLVRAAALAYAAALVVNAARISLALALHRGAIELGGLDRATLHRAEGIAVYLGGLCVLYLLSSADRGRGAPDAARA